MLMAQSSTGQMPKRAAVLGARSQNTMTSKVCECVLLELTVSLQTIRGLAEHIGSIRVTAIAYTNENAPVRYPSTIPKPTRSIRAPLKLQLLWFTPADTFKVYRYDNGAETG